MLATVPRRNPETHSVQGRSGRRKPRRRLPPEVLTDAEVRALMNACGHSATGLRNLALIALLYRSGLRIHEALVHQSLVDEQGAICAYTMIRIGRASSHIEHLKPQAVSRAEGCLDETSDYENMVACFPRAHRAGDPPVAFGAIYREDQWDAGQFISPLTEACEARLRYHSDGHVRARRSNDGAAAWTIETLNLDDSALVEMRLAVIDARGLSLASDVPLKRDEAARLARAIERRNGDDVFEAFCIAIKHAAEEYIAVLDRAAIREVFHDAGLDQYL